MQTLRRTPLYERHAALGARLVPFAGWEMPVQYSGIGEEHRAVRTRAGVFDVSHMGELRVAGEGAREYLQARLSNDLDRIGAGEAQYTLLTNDGGGIVDDLIVYRRGGDDYLLVVNAANVEADHDALSQAEDVSGEWAYLAVQGPQAFTRIEVEIEPFA
ncbi:MAG: glycine cleavage system aminomethyltransferase GcvT, partial [Gaiellaceae bacterium]